MIKLLSILISGNLKCNNETIVPRYTESIRFPPKLIKVLSTDIDQT